MFIDKVDDRVDSGMAMMGAIEKAHAEKIAKMETAQNEKMQELKLQQVKGRGELEGKMKALKVGLWGLGGVTLVGMCGLGFRRCGLELRGCSRGMGNEKKQGVKGQARTVLL